MGNRFVLVSNKEAVENGWNDEEYWGDDDCKSFLYDTSTTPPTLVASDGGEPEDNSFSRNWDWVVPLLNQLASEKK